MADEMLEKRTGTIPEPDKKRIRSRAEGLKREEPPPDDAERAAHGLLGESDARKDKDTAPRDLDEDRVERRTSDETTPPPDVP